jgi:very-short-patch-repair endonuclease
VKTKKLTDAKKALATAKRVAAAQRLVRKFIVLWSGIGKVPMLHLTGEYRPWTDTKHRIDFAQVGTKVAIEIEGGIWTQGRHTRGEGFEADCLKYNRLTMEGWAVIRLTSSMLDCKTVSQVQDFILTRLKTLSA